MPLNGNSTTPSTCCNKFCSDYLLQSWHGVRQRAITRSVDQTSSASWLELIALHVGGYWLQSNSLQRRLNYPIRDHLLRDVHCNLDAVLGQRLVLMLLPSECNHHYTVLDIPQHVDIECLHWSGSSACCSHFPVHQPAGHWSHFLLSSYAYMYRYPHTYSVCDCCQAVSVDNPQH